jgi:hypothetical protein
MAFACVSMLYDTLDPVTSEYEKRAGNHFSIYLEQYQSTKDGTKLKEILFCPTFYRFVYKEKTIIPGL